MGRHGGRDSRDPVSPPGGSPTPVWPSPSVAPAPGFEPTLPAPTVPPAPPGLDFFAAAPNPAPAQPVTAPVQTATATATLDRFGLPYQPHAFPVASAPPPEPVNAVSESRLSPALGIAATVVALVLSGIFQVAGKHFIDANDVIDVSLRRALVLTLGFYLLVGAAVVTFVWRMRAHLVWHRRGVPAALALGLPLGLAGGLLGVAINSAAAGHLSSDHNVIALVGGGGAARIFLALAVTAVLAPLVEETIFRGICAGSLLRRSARPALWVSAIAFAIWHLNPEALRYYALMGLVFAGIWLKRGLIASMSAHAAFNGVLTVAAVLATTGTGTIAAFGQAAIEVPGGWHLDTLSPDPAHSVYVGPSGAALVLIDTPLPESEQTLDGIEQRLAAAPIESGIRVDEASLRRMRTSLGTGVTADFSVANQPAHILAVPYNGDLYELVLVTAGSPAAEHEWHAITTSLRIN